MVQNNETPSLRDHTGFHDLPFDVLDIVFADLPKPTLLECMHVSRLWRECSRPYLFRSLTLTGRTSYGKFFPFLDANTDIAQYVRSLTMRPECAIWPISTAFLVKLMDKLPHLQELQLSGLRFHSEPTPSNALARDDEARPPRLSLLSLQLCEGGGKGSQLSENILFDILFAVAADAIHLSDFLMAYSEAPYASRPRFRSLNPRSLVLGTLDPSLDHYGDMITDRRLYDSLCQTIAPHCLHTLRASRIDRDEVACLAALGNLLSHSAQHTLRDFELRLISRQPLAESEETPGTPYSNLLQHIRAHLSLVVAQNAGLSFNWTNATASSPSRSL
ncbi:hypothetical protein GY45DRAFT_152039 [Cubamyces sp. BRFM 1775]|nr:hypothetical protein GY45DRAFT_152039 [Cubamyces sp. BRFM 1775]